MISSLLKSKLRVLPDKPGCYLMRGASGKIIYVGKASSLRKRVQSYFRAAVLRGSSAKLRSLVHSVADIDLVVAKNEASAILTENKLIKEHQPWFNILLRDDKRFLLLNIDLHQKWPRFRLCRIKRRDKSLYHAQRVIYFGPYPSSAAARAALEFTEKKYGLRKCTTPEPDLETHRHCLNDIIRFCSAPCIGKITAEKYRERVREALAFLHGKRMDVLNELRETMNRAAEELNYEKASAVRDLLQALYKVIKQKAHIIRTKKALDHAGTSLRALQEALGLKRRPNLIQAVDISNISGKHAVGSIVVAVKGICRPAFYRRFRITTVEVVDDAAMMAEVVERHFKRLQEENRKMPDLFLVDGGIVQLRAARIILRQLGIENVAVAGLAKRFEEIYLESNGKYRRLILAKDSPALQLLQRIRDEAHRFAHAYHSRLRSKLIRESVLDEIPGLGLLRKQKLLQRFGSIKALANAPENNVAAVPGIGPALAHKIKSFSSQGPA